MLISRHGDPLLCDFGISKMLITSGSLDLSSIKGSARWMAMELVTFDEGADTPRAVQHSKETDLWAFGMTINVRCLMYNLCTIYG